VPTTITEGAPITTLINVFKVQPSKQRELVELLAEATEQVIRHRPRLRSTNIHASTDGSTVVNYAQWAGEAAFARCWKTRSRANTWCGRKPC
jgi:hypothetical protein